MNYNVEQLAAVGAPSWIVFLPRYFKVTRDSSAISDTSSVVIILAIGRYKRLVFCTLQFIMINDKLLSQYNSTVKNFA